MISVTVASDAAKATSRPRWTANRARARRPWDVGRPGAGAGVPLVTDPVLVPMVTASYSIGRVAIPEGSRPASTQPISVATSGMATRMRKRLSHGT